MVFTSGKSLSPKLITMGDDKLLFFNMYQQRVILS